MSTADLKLHLQVPGRYLNQEPVYALNRILSEICDELKIDTSGKQDRTKAWVVPFFFEKRPRAWRFACVLDDVWGKDERGSVDDESLLEIAWFFLKVAGNESLWRSFAAVVRRGSFVEDAIYLEAYREVKKRVGLLRLVLWADPSKASFARRSKRQHSVVASAPLRGVVSLGIRLRALVDSADERAVAKENKAELTRDDCLRNLLFDTVYGASTSGGKREFQQHVIRWALLFYTGIRIHRDLLLPGVLHRELRAWGRRQRGRDEIAAHVEWYPFKGTYAGRVKAVSPDGGEQTTENVDQFEGERDSGVGCGSAGTKALALEDWDRNRSLKPAFEALYPFYLERVLREQEEVAGGTFPALLVPIYDVWLGSRGYGGTWGCLVCTFANNTELDSFVRGKGKPVYEKLKDDCEILAAELLSAALVRVANQPIRAPYDLVEHVVRTLCIVQDWERVSVHRIGAKGAMYCYRRVGLSRSDDYAKDQGWTRCECVGGAAPCGCLHSRSEGRRTLKWDLDRYLIWSSELLPELADEERASLSQIWLECEYPDTAALPVKDTTTAQLVELALMQQQLEVLRTVLPKVRARRSALRTAAVSIMARNMSHNMGSHVLAEVQQTGELNPEEAKQLYGHLQRRMDFIAELSTAESFYSPARMVLADVLGLTDGPEPSPSDSTFARQMLLLQHITGRRKPNGLPCAAKIVCLGGKVSEVDQSISCAGGMLGEQAFYVILENIIRNSAKHTPEEKLGDKDISLNVTVGNADGFDDYVEVLVWDELGSANVRAASDGKTAREMINDEVRYPNFPRLIDDHGAPVREKWGLREMYIAAAYLREIPLSELEGWVSSGPQVIIEAVAIDEGEKVSTSEDANANLGYRFYVPRAKLLMVVIDDGDRECAKFEERRVQLASHGVEVLTVSALQRRLGSGETVRQRDLVWLADVTRLPREGKHLAALPRWVVCKPTLSRADRDYIGALGAKFSAPWEHTDEWDAFENALRIHLTSGRGGSAAAALAREHALRWARRETALDGTYAFWKSSGQLDGYQLEQRHKLMRQAAGDDACVVFDFHFEVYERKIGRSIRNKRDLSGGVLAGYRYYEGFNSLSPQNIWLKSFELQQQRLGRESAPLKEELLRIAEMGVVILDERIQRALNGSVSPEFGLPPSKRENMGSVLNDRLKVEVDQLGEKLRGSRVYVPRAEEANLDQPDADKVIGWLNKILTFVDQESFGFVDYIVIHQGIIDRLKSGGADRVIQFLRQSGAKGRHWSLVICSGRGIPPQLFGARFEDWRPRFVPISALLEHVVKNPSKIHLSMLLEASRGPREASHGASN